MKMKTVFGISLCLIPALYHGLELEQGDRELALRTQRMKVVARDARIIHIEDVKTGQVIADRKLNEYSRTAGLGCMLKKEKELSALHFPWSQPNFQAKPLRETDLYRAPSEQSKFTVQKTGNEVHAEWRGLTDGRKFFPGDRLKLVFGEDEKGALTIARSGSVEDGGLFGIQIPLENLRGEGKFILPSFGGLEYAAKASAPLQAIFADTTLFYEAQLMTYVVDDTALGMWAEDETFRPFFAFMGNGAAGSSFTLEAINIMPYEPHKSIQAPLLKLDLFPGSGWIGAARPYRDWYQAAFAEDIARRESFDWANKIRVIVDGGNSALGYENIRTLFNPENILVQIWQPRKEGFTTNIPDYTPRDIYIPTVKKLHAAGYKVMCYVCTLCAVYQSPAWNRDNVGDFFLTRKNTINNYGGGKNIFDENLMGTINTPQGKDQYASLKPKAFLYGDPLSKGWRDYFIRVIREFNTLTGTDANYQDTLGCTQDVGNGFIDGLAGAQGNTVFTRELHAELGVPMAAEFGPAPIAFGIKWPLNNAHGWGNDAFRRYRIHHQRPLTPFLFGYRTWVPSIRLYDDNRKHLITSCSDALSGFGMFGSGATMQTKKDFSGHMVLRAKIFADNMLEPYYPEKRYPENIVAMYRDSRNRIFQYYDDGKLQKMIDPDGKALYGRVNESTQLKTGELALPGWPIRDKNGIYGLDPGSSYALFPSENVPETMLSLESLPEGASIGKYYETPEFAYMEITGKGKDAEISIHVNPNYTKVYVNDREQKTSPEMKLRGTLPLRMVFTSGKGTVPDSIRNINTVSSLQEGETKPLPQATMKKVGQILYRPANHTQIRSLDYILPVTDKDAAVELYLLNTQNRYGNGTIVNFLINGKPVKSFDCAEKNPDYVKEHGVAGYEYRFDTRLRKWRIPVGEYAGREILISVTIDSKQNTNADMQWISLPKTVRTSSRELTEEIISGEGKPADSATVKRPAGAPLRVIAPVLGEYKPAMTATPLIDFEPGKKYYLSAKFRHDDAGTPPQTFHFGVIHYDTRGQIHGIHINPLEGSETFLGTGSKAGERKLKVMDTSGWQPGGYVALNASPDFKDLPNRDLVGPVEKIVRTGGDYDVFLGNPLKKDVHPDLKVRMHMPKSTFDYLYAGKLTEKFTEIAGFVTPWPQAVRFQVVIISRYKFEVKDLKLEIFE